MERAGVCCFRLICQSVTIQRLTCCVCRCVPCSSQTKMAEVKKVDKKVPAEDKKPVELYFPRKW